MYVSIIRSSTFFIFFQNYPLNVIFVSISIVLCILPPFVIRIIKITAAYLVNNPQEKKIKHNIENTSVHNDVIHSSDFCLQMTISLDKRKQQKMYQYKSRKIVKYQTTKMPMQAIHFYFPYKNSN